MWCLLLGIILRFGNLFIRSIGHAEPVYDIDWAVDGVEKEQRVRSVMNRLRWHWLSAWLLLNIQPTSKCSEIGKLLLLHGAVVDLQKRDGATPLHIAAEKGHAPLGELLIDNGAFIDKVRRLCGFMLAFTEHDAENAFSIAVLSWLAPVRVFLTFKQCVYRYKPPPLLLIFIML